MSKVTQEYFFRGEFPVVQWLRLWASNAGGTGSIPGWGTKIPHATRHDPPPKKNLWDFPGGPVVKTLCFHYRGMGSIPSRGSSPCRGVWPKKKKKDFFCNHLKLIMKDFRCQPKNV